MIQNVVVDSASIEVRRYKRRGKEEAIDQATLGSCDSRARHRQTTYIPREPHPEWGQTPVGTTLNAQPVKDAGMVQEHGMTQ